jgi:phospholipase C
MRRRVRWIVLGVVTLLVAATATSSAASRAQRTAAPATPIRHLVVILQENVSFDHYFGTYPEAANTDGQRFVAAPGTPAVDGLTAAESPSIPAGLRHPDDLTASNPNSSLPQRLDSSVMGPAGNGNGELTCDQDHNDSDEQQAFDGGAMDQFVQSVGTDGSNHAPGPGGALCDPKTVMDYYDGNVVTAFWNYAQRYAMSDNSFSPTFGPSSPGAVNLISGDTGGVDTTHMVNSPSVATSSSPNADLTADGAGGFSLTSDAQPYWDDCSTRDAVALSGRNIGDELNAADLSWGWFQGGERPTVSFAAATAATGHNGQPTATYIPDEFKNAGFQNSVPNSSNQGICDAVHPVGIALGGTGQYAYKDDYIPHHEPFDYYASTANPHHLTIPADRSGNDTLAGLGQIGTDTRSYVNGTPQFDTPNHQYDISDFDQLVAAITAGKLPATALPAVSFLKAPGYQDGHAAYSDPADEQAFVVAEVNALMQSPDWSSTAIVIAYDDSDGWYDHVFSGVTNPSASPADNLTGTVKKPAAGTSGLCGSESTTTPLAGEQGRCGFGPHQPLLLISPFARQNAIDHNRSDPASIPNFIEHNWHLPAIAGSFDQALASVDTSEGAAVDLAGLFDFTHNRAAAVHLSPVTGQVDLAGAHLGGQNLKNANLSDADLSHADLGGVNLQGAFLENANLQGAKLNGVNLNGADLTGADLTGATLSGVNTTKVIWSNTTCPDGTNSDNDGSSCAGHL